MLLIIEIALVVAAWKKGWRWRAFWPFAVACIIIVVMVAATGGNEASFSNLFPYFVALDVGIILALIPMAERGPRRPLADMPASLVLSGRGTDGIRTQIE